MAYSITTPKIGAQAIADTSTVKNHPLGTIVRAVDPTYGEGEFIYLVGVANTAIGHVVNYDVGSGYVTALDTSATAGPSRPLAIAMSANPAGSYGWYQIAGRAVVKKANTVSFAASAGLGAASGLAVAVATGTVIQAATVAVVASAKSDVLSVQVVVNRPHDPSDVS